jgi:hypothetical protein
MWWNDEQPLSDVEACLRAADKVSQPSLAFRTRVLDEALTVRHRSLSLHRIQTLTSSFLAASLLLFLPGYYHSLRSPLPRTLTTPTAVASAWSTEALPSPSLLAADAYEWGLVQAALAERDQSARALRGSL